MTEQGPFQAEESDLRQNDGQPDPIQRKNVWGMEQNKCQGDKKKIKKI